MTRWAILPFWLLFTSTIDAHELCLKAEKRQGRLYLEAWFDNDTPADGAKVKVMQNGRTVLEGVTDERGVWTAECPPPGTYQIYATDGGGHKAEVVFNVTGSAEPQHAGATKEEVSARRNYGVVIGLGVLTGLVFAGRWALRRRS